MPKIKYEVFNTKTGKFEEGGLDEDSAIEAIEAFNKDFEAYEAEKKIVETLIDMQMNNDVHPKLGNLD
jgi:hypothetical protein